MTNPTRWFVACLVVLAAGHATGQGTGPEPYDPKPFLPGLSPAFRKNAAARMGVSSLSDLPLYQMDLELQVLLGELKGHQEINFKNQTREPLPDLVLRIYPNARNLCPEGRANLRILEVSLNGHPAAFETLHATAIRVPLQERLPPGGRVRVGIDYQASLPKLKEGADRIGGNVDDLMAQLKSRSGQQGYGIYGRYAGVLSLGFFYPILPARVGGDWDTTEPAGMGDVAHFDVANYLVKLTVPKNVVVASSGIAVGEKPLGPGPADKKELFLLGTGLRHFALQLSSRYVVKEKKTGDVRVRYFHVEEHEESAKDVLGVAVNALRCFQKLYGAYPYPELDVAQAPLVGGAGGMEYPGLVTLAMALSGDAAAPSPMDALMAQFLEGTKTVEFVLAHEVAHQWWHVLVGSDSNRYPFLDEALANYAAVMYFEAVHGQDAAAQQIELQLTLPFQMYRLMGGRDGRVNRPVDQFSSQLEYAAIVYGKGGLFFHALRRAVGRSRFVRILRTYARRLAFRQSVPGDFIRIAQRESGKSGKVLQLAERWLNELHGDEDIGSLDFSSLSQVLGRLQSLQGFHNVKVQGRIDPATLKILQQAVQQMAGGPP